MSVLLLCASVPRTGVDSWNTFSQRVIGCTPIQAYATHSFANARLGHEVVSIAK
jgi:hypothetical protein